MNGKKQYILSMSIALITLMLVTPVGFGSNSTISLEAEIVQKGGYSIIAFSDDLKDYQEVIETILTDQFAQGWLYWTVMEKDGLVEVYAYPSQTENSQEVSEVLTSIFLESGYTCPVLYDLHEYLGDPYMRCGSGKTYVYNLASYGFANRASSYRPQGASHTILYDKPYFVWWMWTLGTQNYPSFPYNNKTESVKFYH